MDVSLNESFVIKKVLCGGCSLNSYMHVLGRKHYIYAITIRVIMCTVSLVTTINYIEFYHLLKQSKSSFTQHFHMH